MTDSAPADQAIRARITRRAVLGAGSKLSDSDLALTGFAIGVELAARDLYQAVVDGGRTAQAWAIMRDQHAAYAQRLAGVVGIPADTPNEAVFSQLEEDFTGDTPANAAYRLENTAAATHSELLASIDDPGIAEVVAAIVSMESRHAAYWAERSGRGDDLDALFLNGAAPLTPEAV